MGPKIISLSIFIIAYLLFVFLPRKRTLVAVLGALLIILTGVLSFKEAFVSINWNVMGIFVGTLVVANVLGVLKVDG